MAICNHKIAVLTSRKLSVIQLSSAGDIDRHSSTRILDVGRCVGYGTLTFTPGNHSNLLRACISTTKGIFIYSIPLDSVSPGKSSLSEYSVGATRFGRKAIFRPQRIPSGPPSGGILLLFLGWNKCTALMIVELPYDL